MRTEELSPRFLNLDTWPSEEVMRALYEGQLAAAAAVQAALPAIAAAGEEAAGRLSGTTGRLVYAGAGTSGRIGVQDGSELSPTFGWPEERLLFAIAGGETAFLRSVENAEDSIADGIAVIEKNDIGGDDVVVGLAASGATPFTVAAVNKAAERGALTVGIANNRDAPLLAVCDHPILVDTGAEVIAGSTRMKAGTAQKIVLNILSTLMMVRMGRVYSGRMVNMRVTNAKLRRRSEAMVADITGCEAGAAADALKATKGDVRLAAIMALGSSLSEAETMLQRHGGNLRAALAELGRTAERGMPERSHG
jgi:N-acetylmuramic acid 6-phosphate etherase